VDQDYLMTLVQLHKLDFILLFNVFCKIVTSSDQERIWYEMGVAFVMLLSDIRQETENLQSEYMVLLQRSEPNTSLYKPEL
jgi:hypothetical protein